MMLTESDTQLGPGRRRSPAPPARPVRSVRPARPRAGWHAYRPYGALAVPDWAVELALTTEFSPFSDRGDWAVPSAMLLVRSSSRWRLLAQTIGAAAAEVESLAGVSARVPPLRVVRGEPRPGLEPVQALDVLAHLRRAGRRGLHGGVAPRDSFGASLARWEPGPGAVLTCEWPSGGSAQAVVALAGRGDPRAARPPGAGAVVLRAWRVDRARAMAVPTDRESPAIWAMAFGVVLASPSARSLGRAARRYAADAEKAGWTATVLTGPRALKVALAGDPRNPAPRTAARSVGVETVADVLNACVSGAGSHAAGVADASRPFAWSKSTCEPANPPLWTTAERPN